MITANLPTENAHEPVEKAKQPQQVDHPKGQATRMKSRNIVIEDSTEILNESLTPKNRYKEILSQPADGLSHKEKLLWLQKHRTTGLWAQCDECDRWRYLDNILDSFELPAKWYCKMNPNCNFASCSVPETPIPIRDEEDLIHSKFSAGSIVWARMPGWPWWPAMVDDCPDTEQFYWLDGFSDIPTHFNVVFFDVDVTRSWISSEQIKHYATNKDIAKGIMNISKYKKRLQIAINQANDAVSLSLTDRLAKYSFIAKYKGAISTPKKVNRKFIDKYQKQLKRKFNIEFPIESSSDSEDNTTQANKNHGNAASQSKTRRDQKRVKSADLNRETVKNKASGVQGNHTDSENQKELDSMAVQVSTTASSVTMMCGSNDETTSKTRDQENNSKIILTEETSDNSSKESTTTPKYYFDL